MCHGHFPGVCRKLPGHVQGTSPGHFSDASRTQSYVQISKRIGYVFKFDWILTTFSDSSPVQPAIYTVLHAESESGVKKAEIQLPGAKI